MKKFYKQRLQIDQKKEESKRKIVDFPVEPKKKWVPHVETNNTL